MLRDLLYKDIPYMLEWMRDPQITSCFKKDFENFSEREVRQFIDSARLNGSIHFAVTDEYDVYQGTVSLKNISDIDKNAEYSIVMRKNAQHTGLAMQATRQILDYAFEKLNLRKVYLNCLEKNQNAINFYLKCGFVKEGTLVGQWFVGNEYQNLCLFAAYREKYNSDILHSKYLLNFREKGDKRGHLVVIENMKDIPFEIKRIFYIYGSDKDVYRGNHANRESEFVLINVMGSCRVRICDGEEETEVLLNIPHKGLYIPKMYWKEMYDFSHDAVLLVLCSTFYDENEYIRDKDLWIDEQLKKVREKKK